MNVVFTCGGTGGHIVPAIAIANTWKEHYPDSRILFIGGTEKMERELIPKAGYELISLETHGISRGKSPAAMWHNVKTVVSTLKAVAACKKIFREFGPQVIVGTGGYASFPALLAGSRMGIPTCVHESNAVPGMTTRMAAKWVDRVLVCFTDSAKYYPDPKKVSVVGMPVRREFIYTDKAQARSILGLDYRPVVVSTFGSQGAEAMNQMIAELFRLEKRAGYPFQHIHGVGSFGWRWMPQLVKAKGVDLEKETSISMKEYIYDMPTVMTAADIVISRAGASSCNEIAACGKPCILIPSPNVTDNHQEKNARALENKGGAIVMLEKDSSAQAVMDCITGLLNDKPRYESMVKALHGISIPDSAEQVCKIMRELTKGNK